MKTQNEVKSQNEMKPFSAGYQLQYIVTPLSTTTLDAAVAQVRAGVRSFLLDDPSNFVLSPDSNEAAESLGDLSPFLGRQITPYILQNVCDSRQYIGEQRQNMAEEIKNNRNEFFSRVSGSSSENGSFHRPAVRLRDGADVAARAQRSGVHLPGVSHSVEHEKLERTEKVRICEE